jgi:hypothetical protein
VVTPTIPITSTPPMENTLTLLTILTVPLCTTTPQQGIGLLPKRQEAYQEEQRSRAHAWQIDAKRRAAL